MALYCKWWQEGQYNAIIVNTVISQQEGHRFKPTSWLDPLSMYRLHVNLVAVFFWLQLNANTQNNTMSTTIYMFSC